MGDQDCCGTRADSATEAVERGLNPGGFAPPRQLRRGVGQILAVWIGVPAFDTCRPLPSRESVCYDRRDRTDGGRRRVIIPTSRSESPADGRSLGTRSARDPGPRSLFVTALENRHLLGVESKDPPCRHRGQRPFPSNQGGLVDDLMEIRPGVDQSRQGDRSSDGRCGGLQS